MRHSNPRKQPHLDYSVMRAVRIRIIHWKPEEAGPLVEACRTGGLEVEYEPAGFPPTVRAIRKSIPDALVIDLSRLPSHGREVAIAMRQGKQTRHIPIVFAGGAPEKVAAIRQVLPDAVFTSLTAVCAGVRKATRQRNPNPARPLNAMERYASRTSAQKLGIKEGMAVAVCNAPRDYAAVLGDLPPDAALLEDPEDIQPITLWFVRDPRDYQAALPRIRRLAGRTKLWIVWRKASALTKAAREATDYLTDKIVREWANELGLVDYKICAVDKQWSGMAFAVKKK
jgi:hypothetical protein